MEKNNDKKDYKIEFFGVISTASFTREYALEFMAKLKESYGDENIKLINTKEGGESGGK